MADLGSRFKNGAGANPKQRNIIKGERILKASYSIKCGKNKDQNERSDTVSFTAYCLKTSKLKEILHEINGKVQLNGEIMSVPCSCKADLGEQCKLRSVCPNEFWQHTKRFVLMGNLWKRIFTSLLDALLRSLTTQTIFLLDFGRGGNVAHSIINY
ncbi:hypothetical protein PV325_002104 [Microctonus aethiopoides]|uniref:Uncharacterized protein n=1 Tax=Microctonus aethiopoides TaxID=144406 RepID=A0AA39EZT1_9HYME|nr:hypothetical protein PV325_002104 [Microctonus aethiopoides]KAK0091513.1 hypothetical protein PV326_003088 [Microctonus aethiopoides]KAK0160289.1 hypothetical protein PV328_007717 [Microctonus aethiopoides]